MNSDVRFLSFIPPPPLSVEVEFKAQPSLPVCPSPSAEGTIGAQIVAPVYKLEQHQTWQKLVSRQEVLLQNRVCSEYIHGREQMNFSKDKIPHLAEVSLPMNAASGWNPIRVAGYVPEPVFFKLLAAKCFPCTDFIRHPTELEYTPAPDMFHDIMGHLPLFTNVRFAKFFHTYGLAGLNAKNDEDIAMLGRIYWFTVEFGLMNVHAHDKIKRKSEDSKIYGAGIVSSVGEIPYSLSDKVSKEPFDIEKVSKTLFDIHNMQEHLFEIESFEELESEFSSWAKANRFLIA
jgi:phenylalanine-4-hydroxylase